MSCQCGRQEAKHCSRCSSCQRALILKTGGWSEEDAQKRSIKAMKELRSRWVSRAPARAARAKNRSRGREWEK